MERLTVTKPSPTISIRLPDATRKSLDRAAKLTRRSRSFLMKEALARHLPEIVDEQSIDGGSNSLATLLSLGGAGASRTSKRSATDIDQHIRWLRDNG
jgi:RHH-type transcriptional regulator, rel operon repressor / antitoxin RelB